mgnify:CR=1 FL=1
MSQWFDRTSLWPYIKIPVSVNVYHIVAASSCFLFFLMQTFLSNFLITQRSYSDFFSICCRQFFGQVHYFHLQCLSHCNKINIGILPSCPY